MHVRNIRSPIRLKIGGEVDVRITREEGVPISFEARRAGEQKKEEADESICATDARGIFDGPRCTLRSTARGRFAGDWSDAAGTLVRQAGEECDGAGAANWEWKLGMSGLWWDEFGKIGVQ